MIKKTVTGNTVRFESDCAGHHGKAEMLAFFVKVTLKHNMLDVTDDWIKPKFENGHSFYFIDFFGKHYQAMKDEYVCEYNLDCPHIVEVNNDDYQCKKLGDVADCQNCKVLQGKEI